MKTILFYFILISMFCISCYKPKTNEGDSVGSYTFFSTCGVPCNHCFIEITGTDYGWNSKTRYTLGNGYTNDSGYCEINHGHVSGEIEIRVDDRPIIRDGNLTGGSMDKNYTIKAVLKANGAKLPLELVDYLSYTAADTIYYRLKKGTPADMALRYKVGPFVNTYIDTLSFPNINYAKIIESMGISVLPFETANLLVWGKGKSIYDITNAVDSGYWFNDMGCDFLLPAKLQ